MPDDETGIAIRIAATAIRPLFRLEVPQVLEDQDTRSLILGELDNASAHQMGNLLICVSDFAPEGGIGGDLCLNLWGGAGSASQSEYATTSASHNERARDFALRPAGVRVECAISSGGRKTSELIPMRHGWLPAGTWPEFPCQSQKVA